MNSNETAFRTCFHFLTAGLLLTAIPAMGQSSPEDFTSYSNNGNIVTVKSGKSEIRFALYKPNVVQVEYIPTPSDRHSASQVVIRNTPHQVKHHIVDGDSAFSIITSSLRITCRKFPIRVSFYDTAGQMLLMEPDPGGLLSSGSKESVQFRIGAGEHFYGTGERGTRFDLRGLAFDSFNEQHSGYPVGGIPPTMSVNIPFIVSSNHYGIYFDDTYKGRFDIGHTNPNLLGYTADGGDLSYYFIYAPTYAGILSDYTWLTGRAPLLPMWAYGYIQSKFGYRDSAQAQEMIDKMERDSIPCDAVALDLYWFRSMGDLSWDAASWPEPRRITSGFLASGFRTIVITEPYIVERSINFSTANERGYFAKDSSGRSFLMHHWWSCGCDAGLLDITNPAAQRWWWSKYRQIFETGVSGIWTDLGEPEKDFPAMMFHAGPDLKIHNIYNFLWAKTLFEGYNRSFPNRRFFNLTRSGYAGIQRFGVVTWSGDVAKTFGGLAVQLPILLNMGMSGMVYHNSDIGGYTGDRPATPELYTRWLEFGAFSPVMRAHGYDGLGGTEPWAFGAATEKIAREIIRLRYSLLPYNYTMAHESYDTGLPLARPLVLEYPHDPKVADESSAYLWGDDFLVAPVVRAGDTTKTFYMPRGNWVDYWNDSLYTGGRTVTVAAPVNEIPLFVKSGSIIPMAPPIEHTGQYTSDTIKLAIYPDFSMPSAFNLYGDDGTTLDYQHGDFSITRLSARLEGDPESANLQLLIGSSVGHYRGKPKHRAYICEIHRVTRQPGRVLFEKSELHKLTNDDLSRQDSGYFYDRHARILFIKVPVNTDSSYSVTVENVSMVNE